MGTALISGGTSGIGISIAKSLLKNQYKVHLIGSNTTKGLAIEAKLNAQYPAQTKFHHLDLSNLAGVKDFAIEFLKDHSKLDLLVNTAGIMAPQRTITDEGFEKTFAVGYLSAYILAIELAPVLRQAENGRIANVAGVKSFILNAKLDFEDLTFSKNYSTFKTAITTVHAKTVLTEILSEKFADQGIDVNSFHPGAVKSTLMKNMQWWKRAIFSIPNLFMSKESTTGIFVCNSPDLKGVTGKYFEKRNPVELNFDKEYKQRLLDHTTALVSQI